eukprot:7533603-Alexandrium_andersonii.AAC.1
MYKVWLKAPTQENNGAIWQRPLRKHARHARLCNPFWRNGLPSVRVAQRSHGQRIAPALRQETCRLGHP